MFSTGLILAGLSCVRLGSAGVYLAGLDRGVISWNGLGLTEISWDWQNKAGTEAGTNSGGLGLAERDSARLWWNLLECFRLGSAGQGCNGLAWVWLTWAALG